MIEESDFVCGVMLIIVITLSGILRLIPSDLALSRASCFIGFIAKAN